MGGGGFSKTRLARLGSVLGGYVERGEVAGVVVLLDRRGETHVEAAGTLELGGPEPMARDTVFRIASMTKPVTAAAAMLLVEETRLRLDDPIDGWLPELADRRVLRTLEGPVDDTVPANRRITVRDLLTFRMGFGAVMALPGRYPIQAAIATADLLPGPNAPSLTPDEWMRRLGGLPLLHQPGERWLYHTGSDVLGVLIARASGMALGDFLQERIFAPLGMKDTGFHVPEASLDRLATAYIRDPAGGLAVFDKARDGGFSRPPSFQAGGGGLVSTADDYLAFARMMLAMGRAKGERLLARPTVELMTADHLTAEQKALSYFYPDFWEAHGWGFGLSVVTKRTGMGMQVGAYGWDGGFGTSWRSDPREDLTIIILLQRMMGGPDDGRINNDVFTLAYQALDD